MLTDPTLCSFESAERFTIFTIERSEHGLDNLIREAHLSARKLEAGDMASGLGTLHSLIENLYDFRRFVRDVCALFSLSPDMIGDDQGTMADSADRFRHTLYSLSDALELHNTEQLISLLNGALPEVLTRFRDLMPALRTEIAPMITDAA